MSSAAHSEGPGESPPRRRGRRLWTRLVIAFIAIALIMWQLNAVIWGVHGLSGLLEAGKGPRAFLALLLTHLYQAVVATVRAHIK